MIGAARFVTWIFFLLIATKMIEFLALRGAPIRPYHVYAVLIGVAALIIATHIKRYGTPTVSRSELAFFGIMTALALLIFASPGGHKDFSLRIATWPLANLLMGAALFYFARFMDLSSSIVAA